jgi:hypothetical protein
MRAITGGISLLLALLLAGCGSGGGGSAAPSGEGGTTKLAVQETEVDADSVANTAQLMQRYGVVTSEIDTSKLLQGG